MEYPTSAHLLRRFMVHQLHERAFFLSDPYLPRSGAICSCGHPAASHRNGCLLTNSCGCFEFFDVALADDIRPFYQITHGPMESHALGRGLALAAKLGVEVHADLHCKNWCKNYTRIGAIRHPKSSLKKIQVTNGPFERHLIYCDACAEDLCITAEGVS